MILARCPWEMLKDQSFHDKWFKSSTSDIFDTHLKCTTGSEYQCHSGSVFLLVGVDQALHVPWLSPYNCFCTTDHLFCSDTKVLFVQ